MAHKILRLPVVKAVTGKSRTGIYTDETFPRPIKIGDRAVGWLESDVQSWLDERVKLSRAA
jgi:prophage regulatory protein